MMGKTKPILCLDFDGVLHSYTSGWQGAANITDPPVEGAMRFIWDATDHFRVAIYSSRSGQKGGIRAMKEWLESYFRQYWAADHTTCLDKLSDIEWPTEKPAAFVTIDDRAIQFDGRWPDIQSLLDFKPWNKREFGATGRFPEGKITEDDEGELKLGIAYDPYSKNVIIRFGKPVAWTGMPVNNAREFAMAILKAIPNKESQ
jgi:hypothetical protein